MKALSTRLFALNEAWKENANIYRQMAKQMNLTDMAMWRCTRCGLSRAK